MLVKKNTPPAVRHPRRCREAKAEARGLGQFSDPSAPVAATALQPHYIPIQMCQRRPGQDSRNGGPAGLRERNHPVFYLWCKK